MILPCFKCDRKLVASMPESSELNQPYHGTTFVAYGNYGSGVFDPLSDSSYHLEINICDECLESRDPDSIFLVRTIPQKPIVQQEPWAYPSLNAWAS